MDNIQSCKLRFKADYAHAACSNAMLKDLVMTRVDGGWKRGKRRSGVVRVDTKSAST